MKQQELQEKLLNSRLKVVSSLEFRRMMGVSRITAQKLLERYAQKLIIRKN